MADNIVGCKVRKKGHCRIINCVRNVMIFEALNTTVTNTRSPTNGRTDPPGILLYIYAYKITISMFYVGCSNEPLGNLHLSIFPLKSYVMNPGQLTGVLR